VDISFGEPSAAYRALPVTVGSGIVDALLAEYMRTGVENHLALSPGPASA
jgi:hypothetical protein